MNENTPFDRDDLPLYAMHLLSKEEEAQARDLLNSSSDLRHELAEVQGDLAIYAATVEMHSPPALARERFLTQIGRERKLRPIDRPEAVHRESSTYGAGPGAVPIQSRRDSFEDDLLEEEDSARESSSFSRFVPWLGWAVAAGLAVTTGNFFHENEVMRASIARDHAELGRLNAGAAAARQLMDALKDPTATRVTLTRSKETPAPQGKVTYIAEKGTLLFVASNLDPLDAYKVYELWLIPANGQAPVPAGTFHPDARGNASVVLPKLPSGLVAKAFGVTVEDEGGAETPTMPILLSGAATGI